MILKKKSIISTDIVSNVGRKNCEHCKAIMKSREQVYSIGFDRLCHKIYVHYKCKDNFIDSLKND
jgi:hypothetical protein